jgi:hypothetical protein
MRDIWSALAVISRLARIRFFGDRIGVCAARCEFVSFNGETSCDFGLAANFVAFVVGVRAGDSFWRHNSD